MGNNTTIPQAMPQAIYIITAEQLRDYANEVAKTILDGMKNNNSSNNLLTVDEVSKKFKVNRITVWRWERDGLLKGKKMGRRKYYAVSDIEKIINEQ